MAIVLSNRDQRQASHVNTELKETETEARNIQLQCNEIVKTQGECNLESTALTILKI